MVASSTQPRNPVLRLAVAVGCIVGSSFVARAVDPDQSRIESIVEGQHITTGRSRQANLFTVTIVDDGKSDGLPTILNEVTLHVEMPLTGGVTGDDFEWLLISSDTDGNNTRANFDVQNIDGTNPSVSLGFSAKPLLYIPDGQSRDFQIEARHTGQVTGEFPGLLPSANPASGMYFSADLEAGDFVVDDVAPSSLLTVGGAGPELGPHRVFLERPKLAFVSPIPAVISMNSKLAVVIEMNDYYGNLITANTEVLELESFITYNVHLSSARARAIGPIDGEFHFDLVTEAQPPSKGTTVDRRVDFTNDDKGPGGNVTLGFNDPRPVAGGGFNALFADIFLETDLDSTVEQAQSPAIFETSPTFQTLWGLNLRDLGTRDQLPTAVYELVFQVTVGDGCLFDAQDFSWRLVTDSEIFTSFFVAPGTVIFRGNRRYDGNEPFYSLPAVYTRDPANFTPLLLAQDGSDGFFEIQAATSETNAALDGLTVDLRIPSGNFTPFEFRNSTSQPLQIGSAVDTNDEIENMPKPVLNIASPTFPAEICAEGEGEGEGEGDDGIQSADQDGNFVVSLSELLRVIQFYNSLGYQCAAGPETTEDGFEPGAGANHTCTPYDTDYNPQDWVISLTELLRVIQFYNSLGYYYCPLDGTEDGFCPGTV